MARALPVGIGPVGIGGEARAPYVHAAHVGAAQPMRDGGNGLAGRTGGAAKVFAGAAGHGRENGLGVDGRPAVFCEKPVDHFAEGPISADGEDAVAAVAERLASQAGGVAGRARVSRFEPVRAVAGGFEPSLQPGPLPGGVSVVGCRIDDRARPRERARPRRKAMRRHGKNATNVLRKQARANIASSSFSVKSACDHDFEKDRNSPSTRPMGWQPGASGGNVSLV